MEPVGRRLWTVEAVVEVRGAAGVEVSHATRLVDRKAAVARGTSGAMSEGGPREDAAGARARNAARSITLRAAAARLAANCCCCGVTRPPIRR